MNSDSRYFRDDCDPCRKDPCKKDPCKKEKKKDCPVLIKCGCPGAATIPSGTLTTAAPYTPASLTLDTSCLCDPCIKLEFTSNIISGGFSGSLSFQVVKQCDKQFRPINVGPAFTFTRPTQGNTLADATAFTFFVCDCDSCKNDCCTYTVEVTVVAQTAGDAALNITNATLGAIATCKSSCCC